ncbi:hypothetical protein [Thermus altitudinis]|uniref:hypothetical protein n=1 Tax=Thermus altitudinis TaxID=2908145 RepID=UPI001FA98ED4|nr:hypothetical protein [Thermus altitudinis]
MVPDLQRLQTAFVRRLEAYAREMASLERQIQETREALEGLVPMPVHWRRVRCGKRACRRCPHGPYPYLRVKKDGKWRWQYLGKGWQPPEGFAQAGEFRALLAHYRRLLERLVALREEVAELKRKLGVA